MRARPKILLCSNYEEAMGYFTKYNELCLGIISDIDFPRKGKQDPKAGLRFAKTVKKEHPDVPVLLASTNPENKVEAKQVEASFILKDSPTLLNELRQFMNQHFSFGDFVFRTKDGVEVARVNNLRALENTLKVVPIESIAFSCCKKSFFKLVKGKNRIWISTST